MALSEKFQIGKEIAGVAIREIGANLVALNLYPLGLTSRHLPGEPHPKFAENPRPILMVHGVIHNRSAFVPMIREMKDANWKNVFTINYSTLHGSLTAMVEELAKRVEQICETTHSPQIDIVAHSLGGIVSRYYMCLGEGRGRVKHLVTLGTPHQGTDTSFLLRGFTLGALNSDLRKNSYLISLLNETSLPKGARLTSIYSKYDWVVWPRGSCHVEGLPRHSFKNVEIEDSSHMSLLYSQKVSELVMDTLLT